MAKKVKEMKNEKYEKDKYMNLKKTYEKENRILSDNEIEAKKKDQMYDSLREYEDL